MSTQLIVRENQFFSSILNFENLERFLKIMESLEVSELKRNSFGSNSVYNCDRLSMRGPPSFRHIKSPILSSSEETGRLTLTDRFNLHRTQT